MSNDKTYNGWSNYETWLVNLWSDNNGDTEQFNDYAKECILAALEANDGEDASEVKNEATYELSELLEAQFDDCIGESGIPLSGLFYDLLMSATSEVNFYEIAQHYIADNWGEVYADYLADNAVVEE